ncbi:MAG: carboxynorspermidine decarboxylase, partial [Sulfurospirillum sp.]|nr:carboxynorspermidine decarboxylase [Sulfurospirillum sp.]
MNTPYYLCEERLLRKNLELLKKISDESGANILLALKGFAFSGLADLVSEYLSGCACSGLHEAKFAKEYFNGEIHTYSPAFKDVDIDEILKISNHIVFNSFAQLNRHRNRVKNRVSIGLRINPEISKSRIDLYNPCGVNSRLGVTDKNFKKEDLDGVEGLHFHALFEEDTDALEEVLYSFEEKFSDIIYTCKWINFGGGHNITKESYDTQKLITIIKKFRLKYGVKVYLEPGEAVGWKTGTLHTTVLDIVDNGMKIAILDSSAEAHMPDILTMPYRAEVQNASRLHEKKYNYKLAGNSCLAGDIMGDYSFDEPLSIGSKVIFEDQMHYTIVKNTTFNGVKLP